MISARAIPLLALALTGCASADQLKETPAFAQTLTVPRPYQQVYKDVRAFTKKCYESGAIPFFSPDIRVDAQMYEDEQKGEIDVYIPTPKKLLGSH